MTFPNAIQGDRGQPSKVRIGTVSSDGLFVLQDTVLDPASVGILGSYVPVPGDSVALLGQSAVGTSATSWLALGRVLLADTGTGVGFRGVRVTVGTDTISSGVLDAVVWSAAEYDTDGFWDAATPTQLVLPFDGIYAFTFNLTFNPSAATPTLRYVEINAAGVRKAQHRHFAVVSDHNDLGVATEFAGSAGDVILFYGFQNTGGALTTLEGSATIRLVGRL